MAVKAPALAPEPDLHEPPTGRHVWRWVVIVVLVGVVVGIGVIVGRYVFRERPGAKEFDEALRQFRAAPTLTITRDARYPAPAAGVYELAGRGSEHISFPPSSQQDSPVMPATVTYLPGNCWRWRVDYNVAHWDAYDFCPHDGQLTHVANRNFQSWDLGVAKIKNLAQLTCDPPTVVLDNQPQVGEEAFASCSGTNTALAGQTTTSGPTHIVEKQTLSIGGKAVAAVHQRHDATLTGAQEGTVTEDWWYASATGLPLRVERHTTVRTRSPLGGTITYTEEGSWQMRDLEPSS